jgi:hypothetical protein
MSTLHTVVSRFVNYYTALDSQPPSALAELYHSNATLIDPFGEHRGFLRFSAISPICWPMSKIAVSLSIRRCAAKAALRSPG